MNAAPLHRDAKKYYLGDGLASHRNDNMGALLSKPAFWLSRVCWRKCSGRSRDIVIEPPLIAGRCRRKPQLLNGFSHKLKGSRDNHQRVMLRAG
jgi:hypothetical protein